MITFILENIYISPESPPAVISQTAFFTLDEAKKRAYEEFEKSLRDYCGHYNVDDIDVEECHGEFYIKGPNFTDWWTIVEVQIAEEENK